MIDGSAVIGIITYLSLIIGELVPKQLALRDPERIACLVAPPMTILAKIARPLVTLIDFSGKAILSLLGQGHVRDERVTDAEIHTLVAEAESAGVLEPEERTMIAGVMRLGDRIVRSVMTPRGDVENGQRRRFPRQGSASRSLTASIRGSSLILTMLKTSLVSCRRRT